MTRNSQLLFFILALASPLQAGQFVDITTACMLSQTEHVYLYKDDTFELGIDISAFNRKHNVRANTLPVVQTCAVPKIRAAHCHLDTGPYAVLPSSLNSDNIGDIAFLVYHEQVCAPVRGYGTRLPPIVHLVVSLPRRVVVAYQLGPELLRRIAQYNESSAFVPSGAVVASLNQGMGTVSTVNESVRLATETFNERRNWYLTQLRYPPPWGAYISPTLMFRGDEANFIIREWHLP